MRGAEIIRVINLRALSFCEAPEKFRKFANLANLAISCALLSVSIQCWFSKSDTNCMAPNFSLRSYSCIAFPPSSSVVVSEISKVSRPLPLPLPLPLRPCRCILTHTACFFSCCCCCCCCFCCEVQTHLMLPPTPPELQLCPHMPLSWRGLHPQWCKHFGPPHRPQVGWEATLDAVAASLAATACCISGLRRMMSSRAGPSSSVRFRLVPRSNSDAPLGRWGSIGGTQKLPR